MENLCEITHFFWKLLTSDVTHVRQRTASLVKLPKWKMVDICQVERKSHPFLSDVEMGGSCQVLHVVWFK